MDYDPNRSTHLVEIIYSNENIAFMQLAFSDWSEEKLGESPKRK
jgi:hypothetical protein